MKATDFIPNLRVRYIPGHAHGDRGHKDCEDGTVSSNNGKYVFVKFDKQVSRFGWEGTTSQSCRPDDLVSLETFVNPLIYLSNKQLEAEVLKSMFKKP